MADLWFQNGKRYLYREGGWKATGGATVRMYGVSTATWTPNATTNDYLDDVTTADANALVAYTTLTLIDPSGDGKLDAADAVLPAAQAATGDPAITALLFVAWVTDATDSPMLFLIDSYTGLPVTPSSQDITIVFPTDGIITG